MSEKKLSMLYTTVPRFSCRVKVWVLLVVCVGHCFPVVLGTDLAIEAHTGETVTLRCDGRTLKDTEELQWMFKSQPASSYANGTLCEAGHHINRTWLGSIQQNNFSLLITDVTKEDDGVYTCRISGHTGDIQSIRLIVLDAETDREQRAAGTQQGDAESHQEQRAAGTQQGEGVSPPPPPLPRIR
ncbi:sodium channel subunit beta-3-like [Brienomyrus brachyistius]|uniref:sodium channel subunit beta-3-like n=1 Tax=Brienomyrus brachyistius TaxID=42636 RepID=UPI0020B268FB|nr:sodium channel subunit beta-3-like [Brienomyrus brachyistius]